VDPQDRLAAADVGPVNEHVPVESTWPEQRRIEDLGPVRGREQDDAARRIEAVELHQELVQRLLTLVVAASQTGTALATVLDLTYASDSAAFDQVAAAACNVIGSLLTPINHETHTQCVEATLSVAAEMYQARNATGGQAVAIDFQPSSYRLSVWLTRRVAALTAGCADVRGMVG
jgi:hypothetical protein